jgi:succinate dehydrogenase / fumarate reductase iron-sulfur subunit
MRVQGAKVLLQVGRALRLLLRGKINPLKTLFGKNANAANAASRILDR